MVDIFGNDDVETPIQEYVPLQDKYETKTSVAADILGFAGATLGDFGVSVWNSLPLTEEVNTEDFLRKVDTNSLRMYEEHPDAVNTASFIGGVFVPAGIAMKGMGLARNGAKGVNWFSSAGKAEAMAEANNILRASGQASAEYKTAIRNLYARDIANVVVDNAAAELAILGTMNAHPFMEDYMKDPVSSFTTSILLGTAITAPLSHIGARGEVRRAAQSVYEPAMGFIKGLTKEVDVTSDLSTQIAAHQVNIDTYKDILAKVENKELELDGVTKDLMSGFLRITEANQVDTFAAMASKEVMEAPQAFRDFLIKEISSNPDKFSGINSLSFASAAEEANLIKDKFGKLFSSTTIEAGGIPLTSTIKSGPNAGELKPTAAVFSQRFGAFMLKGDMKNFGVAADLGVTEKNLTTGMTSNWYMTPNYTAWEEAMMSSTAKVDLDYLRKLKAVDEMSSQELSKIALSPDDGPMLNAVLSRWEKLGTEDPSLAASLQMTLTKNQPNWDKIEQGFMAQIPVVKAQGGAGVKASYLQDIKNTVEKNWDQFDLQKANISRAASDILYGWKQSSGMTRLRHAVDDAFRRSNFSGANHGASATDIAAVKEIYGSEASTALRRALAQNADSEGYVYLYRGLRKEGFGSTAVESYTTNAAKAAEFGTPKLYKVKVEDVLGGIRDIAGKAGHSQSTEVLVMSHTREAIKDLPIAERALALPEAYTNLSHFGINLKDLKSWDKSNLKNLTINLFEDFKANNPEAKFVGTPEAYKAQMEAYIKQGLDSYIEEAAKFNQAKVLNSGQSKTSAGFADIREAFENFQKSSITSLLSQGLAVESIALRVGMPVDSVKAIVGGAKFEDVVTRAYTQASEVGTFLSLENKSIQLGTSANKIPVAEIRANLQKKMISDIDQGIKDVIMSSSRSSTISSISSYLQRLDTTSRINMLKSYMEKITPAHLGSKFFTSSDFTLRDMGNAKDLIIEFGKDAAHLKTSATNQILKPVSNAFAAVTKDKAGSIEFITAQNVNASLKGYREYRNGALLVQDELKPWIDITDPMTGAILGKERNMVPVIYQGKPFVITTPSVREAFEQMQIAGRELYELNSTYRKTLGMPAMNDNGFWMPAFNPKDKFISYAFDRNLQTTKLIWGYSAEELEQAEKAYLNTLTDTQKKFTDVIRKGADQEAYNKIANRHDDIFMSEASLDSFHSGSSASARVNTNMGVFSDLANGYEHYIHKSVEKVLELQYSDIFQHLDKLSFISRKATEGNKGLLNIQALSIPHDPGSIVKNTMLAKSNLKDYTAWNQVQNGIQTAAEMTLQTISKVLEPAIAPVKGVFGSTKELAGKDYDNLMKELELRGIPNPFKDMDDAVAREMFRTESLSQAPNMTPRLVALSNSLSATLLLRVMELGQPLVNMLSLPVLTSAAVQKQFKPEFLGAKLSENFHLGTVAAMMNGMRTMGNPEYTGKFLKIGKELGVMEPVVSEVSELLQLTRRFNKGAMQSVENALTYTKGTENTLSAKLIQLLSTGADWSEKAVREFSFATGVSLAKKAYPDLSDSGVITFARNFMDTAIGNYQTSMRPTAFQGTLGVAMGLFQTYMVTLAQQIYGKLELRDYKNLAKMMLTQSSIFGVKGLPGFNLVSEQIGDKFSDQNYDLTTGTYRAVGEDTADLILYGLPSNLGPAVYTRGDIQPRLPNITGGLDNLAAVNILKSGYNSAKTLMKASSELGNEGAASAFAEALSVQTISRPVARISEFFTGHAVTQKGNQVAGPEEIYGVQGVTARVFATRSLQESKAREATYLNTMYGSIDRDNRSEATKQLKNHIRSDTLTPEIRDRIMEKYMRTGSPSGWRSVVNTAMKDTDSPGVSAVRNHLKPNSSANMMIDELD